MKGHELACYCQTPAFCFAIIRPRCYGLAGGENRKSGYSLEYDISIVPELVNHIQYTYVSLPETKIAHENGWKMKFPFRAGPFFRGGLLVSGEGVTRKLTSQNTLWLAESIFFSTELIKLTRMNHGENICNKFETKGAF